MSQEQTATTAAPMDARVAREKMRHSLSRLRLYLAHSAADQHNQHAPDNKTSFVRNELRQILKQMNTRSHANKTSLSSPGSLIRDAVVSSANVETADTAAVQLSTPQPSPAASRRVLGPSRVVRAHSASVKMSAIALLDREVHQRALSRIRHKRMSIIEATSSDKLQHLFAVGLAQTSPSPHEDTHDAADAVAAAAATRSSRSRPALERSRSGSFDAPVARRASLPGLYIGGRIGERAGRRGLHNRAGKREHKAGEKQLQLLTPDHSLSAWKQDDVEQAAHEQKQQQHPEEKKRKSKQVRSVKASAPSQRQTLHFRRPRTPERWRAHKRILSSSSVLTRSTDSDVSISEAGTDASERSSSSNDGRDEDSELHRLDNKDSPRYKMTCDCRILREVLQHQGLQRTSHAIEWDVYWTMAPVATRVYRRLRPEQRISRFPRIEELTRKDSLFVNVARMQRVHGKRHFDIIPETFLLPQEAERLDHAFHRLQNRAALWIVKPHTSSQGRGIFITNSLESIPRNSHLVVSRYISNPYLINKHKFDIRLYVAVTSFDPLRVYVHKQGLVRFAAEPYQVGSQTLSNSFIHLTNYAINKKSARYVCNQDPGKDDIGHKWSISALRRYLRTKGHDDVSVFESIHEVILKTIISVEDQVNAAINRSVKSRSCCFAMLGFDVLLDNNLRPWVLEVNGTPSLSYDSPLDYFVKGEVIADMLTMAGIPSVSSISKSDDSACPKPMAAASEKQRSAPTGSGFSIRYRAASPSYWLRGRNRRDAQQMQAVLVRETQEEYSRRGGFSRVFPSPKGEQMKVFFGLSRDLNSYTCKKSMPL